MKILVSGSTGLIGSALVPFLRSQGHMVVPLVRGAPSEHQVSVAWNPAMGLYFTPDFEGFDAVVNLSGENVASGRWTAEKRETQEQRVVRAQVDHESEDPVAHATDHQHVGVVEQRPHKLDINIRRDVFGLCSAHIVGPTLGLVIPYPP